MSSRQQQAQNQLLSNNPQTSNAMALAQLQAMQQVKSSSIHRIGGSLHTTPWNGTRRIHFLTEPVMNWEKKKIHTFSS